MSYPTLIAGGFSLAMLAAGNLAATETGHSTAPAFETPRPVVTASELHQIDTASNPFPSKVMAKQFADYLAWTKSRGLSRLAAFEALRDLEQGKPAAEVLPFPSEQMAEQFDAYLRWTEEQRVSPFYAFKVTNFD
ncbi:hypothetical protein [Halochromatium roseum]|jgi:hypothetical protein|uniref:hypothetical protein n=1 Tax=Halochromatium roseum TaxID=391920 RepID=UPI0019129350|nr:hypothetical protein [Halochromatium roseum]MBK5937787.1 hypothetical protein [Halochromatium roseum]